MLAGNKEFLAGYGDFNVGKSGQTFEDAGNAFKDGGKDPQRDLYDLVFGCLVFNDEVQNNSAGNLNERYDESTECH